MSTNNTKHAIMSNTNALHEANPFTFNTRTVDPNNLKVHDLLTEMGYAAKPDGLFTSTAEHFGFYKKPVVDPDGNVITNAAEVLAAQQNGVTTLEVFECAMDELELRRFICFTHRYHREDLIASYNTICFYRQYLATEEGEALCANLVGNSLREKIALLMNTSDSTVKRLMKVGDKRYHKLGLIQQGEVTFKEVLYEIKAEQMAKNMEARRAEERANHDPQQIDVTALNELKPVASTTEDNDDEGSDKDLTGNIIPLPSRRTDEVGTADAGGDGMIKNNNGNGRVIAFPAHAPKPALGLTSGYMQIEGLGRIEIGMNGNTPSISVNDIQVDNAAFEPYDNTLSSGSSTHSFKFTAPGPNGFQIKISIENYEQLLKVAA